MAMDCAATTPTHDSHPSSQQSNLKRSRVEESSSTKKRCRREQPPPWWVSHARRSTTVNPSLCFVCQRTPLKTEKREPSTFLSRDGNNSILRYLPGMNTKSRFLPIASAVVESSSAPQSTTASASTSIPAIPSISCQYCDRSVCGQCIAQCPTCQHDYCSLCLSSQATECVTCNNNVIMLGEENEHLRHIGNEDEASSMQIE